MNDETLGSALSEATSDGGGDMSENNNNGKSRKGKRFAPSSAKSLQRWFSSHTHNPYPTEEDKTELQGQTGLTTRQISTWFANARRRNPSKVSARRSSSTPSSAVSASSSISISIQDVSSRSDDVDPLERWRNSPPDQEGASLDAIAQAVASTGNIQQHGSSYDGIGNPQLLAMHARSEASSDSWNYSSSGDSSSSVNSFASFGGSGSHQHQRRRKKRRGKFVKPHSVRPQEKAENRMFQCTFCTETFKSKYDWTRHESTLHLVLEKWTCAPFGPKHRKAGEEVELCVFCDTVNPTDIHLSSHEFASCQNKPISARTFYRKDHLRQHLRITHKVHDFQPSSMLDWMVKIERINCRCGFCGERFSAWPERNEHIANHFREGALMKDWKGCRGLDPAVALHVRNAMPPYLIGMESNEFEPFKASCADGSKEPDLEDPDQNVPTAFENLTARLTQYVRAALRDGALVTDEIVRKQARLIMFGDDDAWNQTPADNAEWLRLFKNGLGLGITPATSSSLLQSKPALSFQDYLRQGDGAFQMGIAVQEFRSLPLACQTPECLAEFRQMQDESEFQSLPLACQTPECLAEFRQMLSESSPGTEALPLPCEPTSISQRMIAAGRSDQDLATNFLDENLNTFVESGYTQTIGNNYDNYSSVDDLVFPFDLNFDENLT